MQRQKKDKKEEKKEKAAKKPRGWGLATGTDGDSEFLNGADDERKLVVGSKKCGKILKNVERTDMILQWGTFARLWWLYDAKWQCPFRSAPVIIKHLSGNHKPIYHPLSNCGDHVVVINSKEIALEGDLWRTFRYFHHTGYPGGFSETRAWKVHQADPTKIVWKSVYSRIKGNLLRRPMMQRLHIFPDEDVPDDILNNLTGQIQQIQPVPRRLDEYTEEERQNFPRMFNWPEDHIINPGQSKEES